MPYDSAVTAALTKAKAALTSATKSGNKTAIANATANVNKVQSIQNSRIGTTVAPIKAPAASTAKRASAPAAKGGKIAVKTPAKK